jgi:NADH pyrophosphatase NudC (nudix superfamily)
MTAKHCMRCGETLSAHEEEGRTRLRCGACGWTFYDNPLPVVAAIVELPEGVVLVRQKGWPEGFMGLVAGFVERGETPEQAVLREVKEELGLDAELAGFIGHYPFEMRNELIVAFHVRATGTPVLSDELEAMKLVPVAKLRPWPLGTGLAVADWLARRGSPP